MANSTIVTLRLSTEIYGVIRAIAEKDDIPVSFVIRRALKKGLGLQQSTTSTNTANTPADANANKIVEGWE